MEKIKVEILKGDLYLDFASFVSAICCKFKIKDQKGFVEKLLDLVSNVKTNAANDLELFQNELFKIISKYSNFTDMKDVVSGAINELKEIDRILKNGKRNRLNL